MTSTRTAETGEQKDKKDIARGAGANFFGFIIRLGSRLPFLFLAVALFGNELYGRYNFTITTIEIMAAFATFGLKRSLFKFIHDREYSNDYTPEQVILTALCWSVSVAAILTVVLILSAHKLADWFDYPQMVDGLINLAPIMVVITSVDVILSGTRATRKMRYEVWSRSIVEPYVLLGAMLLFYFLGYREKGLLMAYAVALCAALLVALWGACRLYSLKNFLSTRPCFSLIRKIAGFSAPTAFHDMALLIFMRMDIFTVKAFFSEGVLGVYTVAQQFATSVEKIYQSFYPILAPVMSKSLVEKDYAQVERHMIMVSRWILMVQCLIVVWSGFYGEAVITAVANHGTEHGILVTGGIILFLLMVGETINGGFGTSDLPLIYKNPLFNPVISLLMIPFYYIMAKYVFIEQVGMEADGVALALMLTYLTMNLLRMTLIKRLFGINMWRLKLFKVPFAAAISAGAFYWAKQAIPMDIIHGWGVFLGIPVLILIYALILVLAALEQEDKIRLMQKLGLRQKTVKV
ncbi:lipopolysaccharide biosynthesis protein [Emcibacter sp.]|uniref:lipopolysaccharide biosynthesis protein n=1 Tax=Emcibacter sp. TaxID=1979954 RepID=UPI002AA8119E|nr:oligosaccharide flippase family protein [Emcibacter sp.]